MYQFTTTTVINSALDSNGTLAKFAGSATKFSVSRVGTFLKDKIVSIHKQGYVAPVKEVAKVTIPAAAGLVLRAKVTVALSQETYSTYVNSTLDFQITPTVEVIGTATAATNATALKNAINSLKDRYSAPYIVATTSTADLIITCVDPNQRIKNIELYVENGTTGNTIVEPKFDVVSTAAFTVTTVGKSGFGDSRWMMARIMQLTNENTRAFGMNMEERPVVGGNYTQYTLRYTIDKDEYDGILSGYKSTTTHIFYVLSTLVSDFETELAKLSIPYGITVSADSVTLDLSNAETATLTTTNALGAVTYTSGTVATATVSGSTVTPLAAGTTVITATDTFGNTDTITITVVA